MINRVKTLPEYSIGKSGHDVFSAHKDLTIVMAPYERFSIFAKSIDLLFKTVSIPFNLIIVESSAPEQIRSTLEHRHRQHKNITILYTKEIPPTYAAFNLAFPHIKTKYVFLMVNDIKLQKGSLEKLIEHAEQHQCDIACPNNSMISRSVIRMNGQRERANSVTSFGLRPSFLMTQDALQKIGKFDSHMNAFVGGLDAMLTLQEKKLKVCTVPDSLISSYSDSSAPLIDSDLYTFQWSIEKTNQCLQRLEDKWNVRLPKDSYMVWFNSKTKPKNNYAFVTNLFAQFMSVFKSTKILDPVKR